MKKVSSQQLTIKTLPKNINLYLQEKARQEKKSLNQVIIECLTHSMEAAKNRTQLNGYSSVVNSGLIDERQEKESSYLDILDIDPGI